MGDFLRKMLATQRKEEDPNSVINAVVYLRVSTGRQASKEFSSIDAQRRMISEYVEKNPRIKVVEEFSDAKSAKNLNRNGFQAMLERIRRGGIDAVISYKNDRVCRNSANFAELKSFLRENNVRLLYSNDMSSDGSPTGDFVEDVTVNLSEMERKKISERTAHKYLQNLKNGYRSGGVAPLGYKPGKKPCEIEIDEPRAKIIRKIFSMYLAGTKPSQIANDLNAKLKEIPKRMTKNGKILGGRPFTEEFVRKTLCCPTYAGYNYINLGVEDGRIEFELFKGAHKSIVSMEDWEKVRETIFGEPKKRKGNPVKANDKYPLKGILKCSCGSLMTASSAMRGHREHRYYICARKNKEHSACSCTTGSCSADAVEGVVFSAIGYVLKGKINPLDRDGRYEESLRKSCNAKRSERERLRKREDAITDELLVCEDDLVKDRLRKELSKCAAEDKALETKIGEICQEMAIAKSSDKIPQSRMVLTLEDMDLVQNSLTLAEKRAVLADAVESIKLSRMSEQARMKRTMSMKITPSPEFAEIIPKTNIRFSIDTSSGKSLWRIASPFSLDCSAIKNKTPTPQKERSRHFLVKIMKWKREMERKRMSLRQFAKLKNVKLSTLGTKMSLLNTLSTDVLKLIPSLNGKEEISRISLRKLIKVSRLNNGSQIAEIRRILGSKKRSRVGPQN